MNSLPATPHRWFTIFILTTLLLLVRSASAALPSEKEKWERVEYGSLTLITNAGEKKAARIAESLEDLVDVAGRLAGGLDKSPGPGLTLYVFKNRESMLPYLPLYEGKPANIAAFFISGLLGRGIVLDVSRSAYSSRVVQHEFVHSWLDANVSGAPLWLHEGLAEYYSTFEVDGDLAIIGRPVPGHVEWLRRVHKFSLARLMSIDQGDAAYNEGVRQGSFYAQAWSLIHFVMSTKERRAALRAYLGRLRDATDTRLGIDDALGVSTMKLQAELAEYLAQPKLSPLRVRLRRKNDREKIARRSRRLSYEETLISLGNLLNQTANTLEGAAEEHFQAVLQRSPDNVDALCGLALNEIQKSDYEACRGILRRALQSEPDHATANRFMGFAHLAAFEDSTSKLTVVVGRHTPSRLNTARRFFERSLQAEPANPLSLAGLGATYSASEDPSAGIAALGRACEMMPDRTEWQEQLVRLHLLAKDWQGAWEVMERSYRARASRAAAGALEARIVESVLLEAGQRIDHGQADSAVALLRLSEGHVQLASLRRLIENELDRVKTITSIDQAIHELDHATDLARTGDYEGALEVLDALLPTLDQPELVKAAHELRDRLRASLKRQN